MCSKTIFENWLFSASIKGAEANAMIYAVAATASVNGLHMKDYFTRFFTAAGDFASAWVNMLNPFASRDGLAIVVEA